MAPLIQRVAEFARHAIESRDSIDRLVSARASWSLNAARMAVAAAPEALPLSTPTGATDEPPTPVALAPRQQQQPAVPTVTVATVPGGYAVTGPDPGTVVGITLGAVAGFLLVLWMVYTCINLGSPAMLESASSYAGTASVVTRKSRGHSHHRHSTSRHSTSRHHGSRRRVEVVRTTSTSRPPPSRGVPVVLDDMSDLGPTGRPRVERVERVVESSTTTHRVSGSRPPPSEPSPRPAYGVPVPGPRIIGSDDEDDSEDDEVVVIEERSRSPPRRHRSSRRGSSAYEERRHSGSRRR